ncbi:MAG: ribonuclease Z, partial [bacterium]
ELAQNADLLIHEATFDESRSENAEESGHTTIPQAAEVARQAGAKKLLLTHISARYDKTDDAELLTQATKVFPNTLLGQDLMRIEV